MGHALIVEDDLDAARMMAALVTTEGLPAATAPSLRDARRPLALQPPDLVLLDLRVMKAEVDALLGEMQRNGRFGHMVGRSGPMQLVYEQIARVSGTSVSVFITGASGTGKELVARTVHDLSRRRARPFLAVNCGAISPHLIESEIFGHEQGSVPGAERQHLGFFERAHGGTLFLDEVTEMPPGVQVKLLRLLESGTCVRLGSTTPIETDVRVIAATNRNPAQAVASGALREDLMYRLNVFPIELPPLSQRREDLPLLVAHFLREIGIREGTPKHASPQALKRLAEYGWPGNVRELRNVLQRAYVMTAGSEIADSCCPATSCRSRDRRRALRRRWKSPSAPRWPRRNAS